MHIAQSSSFSVRYYNRKWKEHTHTKSQYATLAHTLNANQLRNIVEKNFAYYIEFENVLHKIEVAYNVLRKIFHIHGS